jgi:2-haloalkanoic acid dehalogenase type II
MTRVGEVEALTFDCYGTLIDWYGGVREAARASPSLVGLELGRFVRDRDAEDRVLIQGPYRPYAEVLALSAQRAAAAQGRVLPEAEARAFAASQGAWPPFDESRAALARLGRRFRLAILSNVDTAILARSVELLGGPFEFTLTAQELGSYKPRPAHWEAALTRLGLPPSRVLHVGCSLFHDMRPAAARGIPTAFVNRDGEPLAPGDAPTLVLSDLASLCDVLGV